MISQDRLKELLHYDPETGEFTWAMPGKNRVVGRVAGTLSRGYIRIRVDIQRYSAHRLAFLWMEGRWPEDEVDHIDGEKTNNRWANLRDASRAENMQNERKARTSSSTGILGVSLFRGKFAASIKTDGKKKHLGFFDTPEEASAVYRSAKKEQHKFYVGVSR